MSLPQNDTSSLSSRESNVQSSQQQTNWCALLTGAGRSAIAVIALGGPSAQQCLAARFQPVSDRPWQIGQIRYGRWWGITDNGDSGNESPRTAAESVVVLPTAPDQFEIHCHGGKAAITRILDDLEASGVQVVRASSIPEKLAIGNLGAGDSNAGDSNAGDSNVGDSGTRLMQVEAREVLVRCTTARTAAIALDQVRGGLWKWREKAIAELEKSEQGFQATAQSDSPAADAALRIAGEAAEIAGRARFGLRLTRPFDVVLAGPPNVGKSSLINAIIGYERSITMNSAGTTRDVLDAETVVDGWPLRFRDTAGLHRTDEVIEQHGIERALAAIGSADLIIQVSEPGIHLDQKLLRRAKAEMGPSIPLMRVINKADLAKDQTVDVPEAEFHCILRTIATTGEGIESLMQAIIDSLQLKPPESGSPVPINERQHEWVKRIGALGEHPLEILQQLRTP